ncbi:NAD(P)H-quinone oxidoreductase [Polycladidibacter hongkongensis]|uniref:NAD(P)H-quinone oxidoreductase n=1 Tax=Polycladidibacter hongkongensis TaxID=1647556 RepID=UPI001FCABE0D|nr:NAD(P)H-quinone oxidoreductase [Pseudovibrio hongkongensis]
MMQAVEISAVGGPEVLRVIEVDLPVVQAGQVLIEVAGAGVNRPDILQRQGVYPAPQGASPLPGLEVSGRVHTVGEGVDPELLGQEVCALVAGGGYAQFAVAEAAHCLPVPVGVSLLDAAGLPEVYMTVWSNVFQRCGLKAGESFLVHGGSSGIGICAVQLAKAFGACVFTTVGSEEKVGAVLEQGADIAINYKEQDFVKEVLGATDKRGVDVILDMVGGDYVERNWKAAAVEGRICQIAALTGVSESVNINRLMMKRLTHTGSTLRARSNAFKAQICAELKEQVWPLFAEGRLRTVVDSVYSLASAEQAHRRMESSAHIGKILLKA